MSAHWSNTRENGLQKEDNTDSAGWQQNQ